MSETTVNLEMPYILPSQAQKHVTHNEALQRLDAAVQLTFAAIVATPPESPAEGACFAIGPAATDDWAGRSGRIAMWQDAAWLYLTPRLGWRAWNAEAGRLAVYDGDNWVSVPLPDAAACETLGISTSADSGNRLAVSSPATLLTHAGESHQLKINKSTASDTASLLFQSGWAGFAEMGLNGSNSFSIKVNDGASWSTAIAITPSGVVDRPLNPAFRAWCNAGTISPAAGSLSGFQHIHNLRGNATLSGTLAIGQAVIVPAAGLYLLTLQINIASTSGYEISLLANESTEIAHIKGGNTGSTALTATAVTLAMLAEGDSLCLSHAKNAELECNSHKTTLAGVLL